MASDGVIIWEQNYVHIDETMNDEEILKIIFESLQNKEKLMNISNNMQEKMEKNYSLRYFTRHLIEQL